MRVLISFAALALLTACGESAPDDAVSDDTASVVPPVGEMSPAAPESLGDTAELEADENVPSLAEVQYALRQCAYERDVSDADCSATGEGTEFTCRYTLDGDTTEREAFIAADGDTYTLIDIPEDCPVQ